MITSFFGGPLSIFGIPIFTKDEEKPKSKEFTVNINGHDVKLTGDHFESLAQAHTILSNEINNPPAICNDAKTQIISKKTGDIFAGSGIQLIIKVKGTALYKEIMFKNNKNNIKVNYISSDSTACNHYNILLYNAQYYLLGASQNLFVLRHFPYVSYNNSDDKNTLIYPIIIEMDGDKVNMLIEQYEYNKKIITDKREIFKDTCYQLTDEMGFSVPDVDETTLKSITGLKTMPEKMELLLKTKYKVTYTNTDSQFPQFNGLHRYIIE